MPCMGSPEATVRLPGSSVLVGRATLVSCPRCCRGPGAVGASVAGARAASLGAEAGADPALGPGAGRDEAADAAGAIAAAGEGLELGAMVPPEGGVLPADGEGVAELVGRVFLSAPATGVVDEAAGPGVGAGAPVGEAAELAGGVVDGGESLIGKVGKTIVRAGPVGAAGPVAGDGLGAGSCLLGLGVLGWGPAAVDGAGVALGSEPVSCAALGSGFGAPAGVGTRGDAFLLAAGPPVAGVDIAGVDVGREEGAGSEEVGLRRGVGAPADGVGVGAARGVAVGVAGAGTFVGSSDGAGKASVGRGLAGV